MTTLKTFAVARENGVTPSSLHALLAIMSEPPMSASRVAVLTGVTTSAVTGILDTLEKSGMVTRGHSKLDRRVVTATPTEKAVALFTA